VHGGRFGMGQSAQADFAHFQRRFQPLGVGWAPVYADGVRLQVGTGTAGNAQLGLQAGVDTNLPAAADAQSAAGVAAGAGVGGGTGAWARLASMPKLRKSVPSTSTALPQNG
jgi:hypothetical protein